MNHAKSVCGTFEEQVPSDFQRHAMKVQALRVVTLCHWVNDVPQFRQSHCPHVRDKSY